MDCNGVRMNNFVEETEYGGILDMLNFKVASRNPMNQSYRSPAASVRFPQPRPPPPQHRFPYCAQCDAVENTRLRGENQFLKNELQQCYMHMKRQHDNFQEVKMFLEHEKKKNSSMQSDMERLSKNILEQHVDQDRARCRIAELEAELKKMTEMGKETERKLEAHQQQIKELEVIMIEEQNALEHLGLEKMLLEGKLKGIREFVKEVNTEFELGIETLKRDHDLSGHCLLEENSVHDVPNENNDEDENEMKDLQMNLTSLATLVRETMEEFKHAKQVLCSEPEPESTGSLEITKISLKKTASSSEAWSIVPSERSHNLEEEEDEGPPVLYPFTDNEDHPSDFSQVAMQNTSRQKSAPPSNSSDRDYKRIYDPKAGNKIRVKNQLKPYMGLYKYQCKLCKGRFAKLVGLKFHYQLIHKIPGAVNKDCVSCGLTFPTKGDFYRHYNLVHRKSATSSSPPITSTVSLDLTPSSPQTDQQRYEQMTFWSFETLDKLMNNSTGKNALDCDNNTKKQSMISKELESVD